MRAKHPIRVVAKQTGLSSHLIRAWERRYEAVVPERSDSGQRLYSDEDIVRLKLLKAAVDSGEAISQAASLSGKELRELIRSIEGTSMAGVLSGPEENTDPDTSPKKYLADAIEAVRSLDTEKLEHILMNATADLSRPILLEGVMEPLMYKIGELWKDGTMKIAHEHIASAVVRTFLGNLSRAYRPIESAPKIVITTPAGQLHEFGALISAIIASADGWNAVYLGPNSPSDDIANVVRQKHARVVALSIVYPADDPRVSSELRTLRQLVGPDIHLLIGGRSAANYLKVIEEIGAHFVENIEDLRGWLRKIRQNQVTV